MNAPTRTNPYALTFAGLTRTLVSVKDQVRALADAPHSLNRRPIDDDSEPSESERELRARLDAELADQEAFPLCGFADENFDWTDPAFEEMPE